MAPTDDNGSPWADLDTIFAIVGPHNETHIESAIESQIGKYRGSKLDQLYALTVAWGATFVRRGPVADQKKRQMLTSYIMRRGLAQLQAQNEKESLSRVDPVM